MNDTGTVLITGGNRGIGAATARLAAAAGHAVCITYATQPAPAQALVAQIRAAYKAAVEAFTVGLAKELAEEGIRVNAVPASCCANRPRSASCSNRSAT